MLPISGHLRNALAADDHRCDAFVGHAFLDRGFEALPDRGAERGDRRVVRDDDEDVVVELGGDRAGHRLLLFFPGEGRGPVAEVFVTVFSARQLKRRYWAPAFAGEAKGLS